MAMISTDRPTGRTVSTYRPALLVVGLLALTIVALHGWIPGAPPPATDSPRSPGPATLPLLIGAVGALVLLAIWGARGSPGAPPLEPLPERFGGSDRRAVRLALLAVLAAAAVVVGAALLPRDAPSDTAPPSDVARPTATTSTPPESGAESPAPAADPGGAVEPSPLLVLVGALLLVLLAVTAIGRGRASEPSGPLPDDGEPAPSTGSASLVAATELGLAEIADRTRAPRAAIIACYAALERGLAGSPELAPQAADTPAEVLARVVRAGALPATPVGELVELFTEARFSPHHMGEAQRDRAVARLRQVLAELRSSS